MVPNSNMPYLLMQAFLQLHRQKTRFRPVLGVNPGEIRVLRCIKKMGAEQGVMVSELSECLKVSSSFITQASNNLVKKGLALRSPDRTDRRVVRLQATEAGHSILAKASRESVVHFEGLVTHLGLDASGDLLRLLERVYEYFETVEVEDHNG